MSTAKEIRNKIFSQAAGGTEGGRRRGSRGRGRYALSPPEGSRCARNILYQC
ncbi:hypothetical protein RSAG8_03689, partial [Rhizoctonia solani AG-8 WAC10335]